jgi:hypothetical protein
MTDQWLEWIQLTEEESKKKARQDISCQFNEYIHQASIVAVIVVFTVILLLAFCVYTFRSPFLFLLSVLALTILFHYNDKIVSGIILKSPEQLEKESQCYWEFHWLRRQQKWADVQKIFKLSREAALEKIQRDEREEKKLALEGEKAQAMKSQARSQHLFLLSLLFSR